MNEGIFVKMLIGVLAIMAFLIYRLEKRVNRQDEAVMNLLILMGICLKMTGPGSYCISVSEPNVDQTKEKQL